MIDYSLLFSVLIRVGLLIFLILKFKFQPFLALLLSSILVGILAGVAPTEIMVTVKDTFRSWSVMTTLLALKGFSMVLILSLFV